MKNCRAGVKLVIEIDDLRFFLEKSANNVRLILFQGFFVRLDTVVYVIRVAWFSITFLITIVFGKVFADASYYLIRRNPCRKFGKTRD
ncbi:hypothetical protein A5656_19235 [Mycobacterium gordonae]|nr:hypothetical protein A5656_19235 [Mycobacterium gordonae]